MILTINFKNKDGDIIRNLQIKDAEYIPDNGDLIYNSESGQKDYKVTRKDIFYNLSMTPHICVMATEQ